MFWSEILKTHYHNTVLGTRNATEKMKKEW